MCHILGLHCEFPAGVESLLALLLGGLFASLEGSELSALGTGQLGAQILGLVLLAVIELAQVLLLRLVHHRQHAGDGLAHNAAATHQGRIEFLIRLYRSRINKAILIHKTRH